MLIIFDYQFIQFSRTGTEILQRYFKQTILKMGVVANIDALPKSHDISTNILNLPMKVLARVAVGVVLVFWSWAGP